MIIHMPDKVKRIISVLQKNGYEAYAVGGCVRDAMLGRTPNDWDITTSALPKDVKALFRSTIDTGIQHGTVTVMLEREGFEVTTYRIDGEYEDARHPKNVEFTASLSEDLKRRDFTINAMAYNDQDGLVDLFEGEKDLKEGRIRCVGNPTERFTEDALRILRAFRFSAQLGFFVEDETLSAAGKLAENLQKISAERIYTELSKLLCSAHPQRLYDAYRCGVTKYFLPELDAMYETPQNHSAHYACVGAHSLDTLLHTARVTEFSGSDGFTDKELLILRLSALLHDVAKPECRKTDEDGIDHFAGHAERGAALATGILRRLKTDNQTLETVKALIRWHDYPFTPQLRPVRHAMNKIGPQLFPLLFSLRKADLLAHNDPYRTQGSENLRRVWEVFEQVLQNGECTCLKNLAVTGADLIQNGIPAGKHMGAILEQLLQTVIEDPQKNEKELLLAEAKKLWEKNEKETDEGGAP